MPCGSTAFVPKTLPFLAGHQVSRRQGRSYPLVYDHIIRCLGWRHDMSMFGPDSEMHPQLQPNGKFPSLTAAQVPPPPSSWPSLFSPRPPRPLVLVLLVLSSSFSPPLPPHPGARSVYRFHCRGLSAPLSIRHSKCPTTPHPKRGTSSGPRAGSDGLVLAAAGERQRQGLVLRRDLEPRPGPQAVRAPTLVLNSRLWSSIRDGGLRFATLVLDSAAGGTHLDQTLIWGARGWPD